MNKNKLKYLCSKLQLKSSIDYNRIRKVFYLEELLRRISKSKFKENLIFKGGMLFSNIIGIEKRCTVDVDFSLKKIQSTEKNLIDMFNIILDNDNEDIKFNLDQIKPIETDLEYPCFRMCFNAKLENEVEKIIVDIGVGDKIFPKPLEYQYKSFFGESYFLLNSYTLETFFSEKIFAIFSKGKANTRLKDYFDVFYIIRYLKEKLNFHNLKKSILLTFENQNVPFVLSEVQKNLKIFSTNRNLNLKWRNYKIKNNVIEEEKFKNLVLMVVDFLTEIFE